MDTWTPFPWAVTPRFDSTQLQHQWSRLHMGDAEPWPERSDVLEAWIQFHNGEFQRAALSGIALGDAGLNVANKATCIYANYLEPREHARQQLLLEAAARAEALQKHEPDNAGAWYWQAYALARYSQCISVAKALAQGLGVKIRHALETTITLAPRHADAHLALAGYHAEVIDKVGALVGGMTHGASKEVGLALYQKALVLNPDSAITLSEYANGLLMLEGYKRMEEARHMQDRAAAVQPLDAMEQLYVASVRLVLEG
jgi:tetratricopeptide (TPR) repeat protein